MAGECISDPRSDVFSVGNGLWKARQQRDRLNIPPDIYQAWRSQRSNAKGRGISFLFSPLEFHLWWTRALAAIGPDARRGKHRVEYVMCRYGDQGAYEPANVFAGTPEQNAADRPLANRAASARKTRTTREANGHPLGEHLMVRGDGHPKSKAILTPAGRFGSIALAAEHYGLTRAGAYFRVKNGHPGWQYDIAA